MYMIEQGDTLYNISRRYNTPLALILKANPYVDIYRLQVGDEICIPNVNPSPIEVMPYQVEEGDSLGSVLNKLDIELQDLLNLNRPEDIMLLPGSTLCVPNFGEEVPYE